MRRSSAGRPPGTAVIALGALDGDLILPPYGIMTVGDIPTLIPQAILPVGRIAYPSPMRSLFLPAALLLSWPIAAQTTPSLDVRVDPRVELLGIVYRLAGSPEYSKGRLDAYNHAVDARFAAFRDHAVVARARALRESRGISYDAVASFAIHLDGIDPPRFPGKEVPARLDSRWTGPAAGAFLADLADFVTATRYAEFFASRQPLHRVAETRVRDLVSERVHMPWFTTFFGERPRARFHVVLGLLNGPGNYGPSALAEDGSEDLYAILGCSQQGDDGGPAYDATIVPTLVHEYCHSFCNPVIAAHAAAMAKAGDALFARTERAMRDQAYGNGHTLLCESLVRASVIRYRATVEGDAAAREETREQGRRMFLWAGDLAHLLAKDYETDRTRYPTLQAFGGPLATFFAAAVGKLDTQLALSPKVLSTTPADAAVDVDPATTTLIVTFDRPMQDGMWSVVGGGERFPELTGKPAYDQARRVLSVPIALLPEHDYELWLNRGEYDSFRAAGGTPLAPVHIAFHTGPAREPPESDLRPQFAAFGLPPRHQGARPTCSIFTVVSAYEFALAAATGKGERLSVEFVNWAANAATRRRDDGDFFHHALAGVERFGLCAEADLPYAGTFPATDPPAAVLAAAAARLTAGLPVAVRWIRPIGNGAGLDAAQYADVLRTLAAGTPVAAGSAHSRLLVGFRREPAAPGGGRFLALDSGSGRFAEVDAEFVRTQVNDAFVVEPRPPAK